MQVVGQEQNPEHPYFQMSIETRTKLGDFLLTIAEFEQEIEQKRLKIAQNPEFEPYLCFTRIDREQKGHITAYDLNMFLQSAKRKERPKRYYLIEECVLLVLFFDATFQ